MSDVPIEKKLELIRQIRARNYQNQSDLINREQILYGRTGSGISEPTIPYSFQQESTENLEENIFRDNTLKLRYALAAVLLVTIILLDRTEGTIAGVSMERVFSYIAVDYEAAVDAWTSGALAEKKSITP